MSAAPQLPYDEELYSRRKRFTRQEVERLLDMGFFDGQRYELIDGELLDKMGQNPPHAEIIQNLTEILGRIFGNRLLRIQLPMEASGEDRDRSVPEPDVAVLRERKPEFKRRHPRGHELLLLVEVSDSSSRFDLGRKAQIYAAAGVPEYWVVDVKRGIVDRRCDPAEGAYRLRQSFSPGESVPLDGCPEGIPVNDILPSVE
jgi:Uma2 family endonuclease